MTGNDTAKNDRPRLTGACLLGAASLLTFASLVVEVASAPKDDDGMYAGFTLMAGFVMYMPVVLFTAICGAILLGDNAYRSQGRRSAGIAAAVSTGWSTFWNIGWLASTPYQPHFALHIIITVSLVIVAVGAIYALTRFKPQVDDAVPAANASADTTT
jgi:hypothetical protein